MTSLAQYSAARAALAEATRVEQILPLRQQMAHIKLHARHVQDRELLADATEIQIRAERRLGELLLEAERSGFMRPGRPKIRDINPAEVEGFTLKDIGVSHKLSATAQQKASLSEQAVEAMIASTRDRIIAGRAMIIDELGDAKAERRAVREADLADRQRALPDKRYGVIYCDPEWRYEPWSRETGMDRAADNHYPTSTLEAICARDVGSIAAPDCLLAMWAIVPMLAEAFVVLDAWGFGRFDRNPDTGFLTIDKREGRYVSSGSWTKYKPGAGIGMGYWFRVDHEILLLATRGNIPAPALGTQSRSVFDVPASEVHSQKPELVCEILESYFPNLPKIELNRRGPARPGWDAWGNEAEDPEEPVAAREDEVVA